MLVKGDFIIVNYIRPGYDVVDYVCEVSNVSAPLVGFAKQSIVFLAPSKAQGNGLEPELGAIWSLPFPSDYAKQHFPPVKVGDMVLVTGLMFNATNKLPDERGQWRKILRTDTLNGVLRYRLIGAQGTYWYDREAFSTNPNADCNGVVPVVAKPLSLPKYKCINPRKESA